MLTLKVGLNLHGCSPSSHSTIVNECEITHVIYLKSIEQLAILCMKYLIFVIIHFCLNCLRDVNKILEIEVLTLCPFGILFS